MQAREGELRLLTSIGALDQQLSIYLPELPPSLGSNQLGGCGHGAATAAAVAAFMNATRGGMEQIEHYHEAVQCTEGGWICRIARA